MRTLYHVPDALMRTLERNLKLPSGRELGAVEPDAQIVRQLRALQNASAHIPDDDELAAGWLALERQSLWHRDAEAARNAHSALLAAGYRGRAIQSADIPRVCSEPGKKRAGPLPPILMLKEDCWGLSPW